MRRRHILWIFLALFCCSSCVDVVEHYDFKADGSCRVAYNFDMSRAVAVLMNLMPDSVKATPQFSMREDTTLNFFSALPDSSQQKMTAEQASIAKSSNLSVQMNLPRNLMKVSISHQSKNAADLQFYLRNIARLGTTGSFAPVKAKASISSLNAQQLLGGQDYYAYEVTPHKFYRIIDKAKFNAFLKKTQATFAMAKAMLIEMPYKLVLNFARPVKKVNNPRAIVSADRRQVVLQTTMDEVISNPTIMNLKIDF